AVAGQSIVKLYAAAMFPGFFLSFLYLVYIIGWAMINPKIAPRLPEEQMKVPVPAWLLKFEDAYRSQTVLISLVKGLLSPSKARQIDAEGRPVSYWMLLSSLGYALVPFMIVDDAAGHSYRRRARCYPVRHHHRDRVRRRRRRRRVFAGGASAHAGLETHQGSGVPDRENHRNGVLAVRWLGAVLRRICDPRR